jgi:Protein of unknown function (DUF993)
VSATSTTATKLHLPRASGAIEPYAPGPPSPYATTHDPPRTRVAFAAAHVVADPLASGDPDGPAGLDWEATLAFRRHLWAHGFRVAEAMDTAQRGMGLDWAATQELIRRSVAEARATGGEIAAGAGTDHLPPGASLDDVRRGYEEQCAIVEGAGAQVILMASRALAATATAPDDYADVYGHILAQLARPAILHWLGPMFDPALDGYWYPAHPDDLDRAADTMLAIVTAHQDKVDGIKVSLLDLEREIAIRSALPDGVRLYTGDDFHYPELIRGGSDALLGIFDAIAPAAGAALAALDAGDTDRYDEVLAPTVPLARHIFERPTYHYKTGIVFLAYLNGHQRHFRMVGGRESARSVTHLAELFVLADRAGLLTDPETAASRMRTVLELAGIDQP